MNEKQCYRCGYRFKESDAVVHRAYGDYHERCYRELCGKGTRMAATSLLLLILVSCASAPVTQARAQAKRVMNGCTAAMTTMGSVLYERVTVVGITPQGSTYWVYYPDRKTVKREGHGNYAEALPVEQFIERGKIGHAGLRPCRCPNELWGQ